MTRRFGIVLGLLAVATVGVPATFVQAETDDTEQSAFREAVKFGFHGEAIQGGVMIGDAPAGTRSLTFEGIPVPIDADGKFIIAFNRDAGQAANLVATLDNGQTVRKFINIAPRNWQIEHVSINRRATTRSAAFLALRGPELAQINAARSVHSDSKGWRESFIWPAKGRISGQFGSQRIYNGDPGSYHSGVDIAAPAGTYYVAPADGVVTLAASSPFTLEGNLLMIDHGMGLNSAFLHSSEILVKEGQQVKRGEPIGRIGSTGSATGPHLHWSMKWNDARIDPTLLTGPMD
ncbi:M23 family metallopeptidase [Parasphingorhabdus sp.]|uniref:M23 family metallopeptidase n=1 Tax=Parasphingorhabdus sp. TaxID=2709688 RepID=UPI003A903E90